MREYLFRGKRKDNGEWVEGDLRHGGYYLNDPDVYICIRFADTMMNYPVDPETVGQYTGLNVRGEKVFEGDILKITDKYGISVVYIVEFYMGAFALKQMAVEYRVQFVDFHLRYYDFEILGNIHDNPELLKEGGD